MNKFLIIISLSFIASCGAGKSGKQIGEEVCDCSKKANALPVSDTGRSKAQDDCLVKQKEAWDKVKDDKEKADEFNAALSKCATEEIKKSFGQ